MSLPKYKFDLEDRLITFASMIIACIHNLAADKVGNHLGQQLLRSGTSPALNYVRPLALNQERTLFTN